ncbi:Teichoic acids export ATP-binding protein TagH [Pirellulimonas nuda]|uniref:Teichoic acids export ATP-binding protein TagH n=1 Tax=Pirellulimonas nuda TaxID=2528009 RepID=A0A518DD06_9BACT|nr:polysaccharide ABC transporter ATP-binding protein [Pirellulimonas nuda]QDU89333.1 Teichoic acids export ATP-binding protein TagH [Pirellulimonas nuda]
MTQPIISVENLGKAYRLGQREEKYPTFRDALVGAAKAPLRRFRNLSGGGGEEELFWALKDVSFEVQQGEVVGIIGRNGAGKSTLLKVLSRITEPTTGRAVLRGRVASLLEVGTGFHPELTGRENIYLNGSILGMKKREIDRKFEEIVAFAEVERFLDTPVKRYSSGMYVRLAFAVAAHLDPEILIVDEVLAVGDAQFQEKCLGKMQEVSEGGGRTVLFVSHNMAAVRRLCNRCIVLTDGEIEVVGQTADAIDRYLMGSQRNASKAVARCSDQGSRAAIQISEVKVCNQLGDPTARVRSGDDVYLSITTSSSKSLDQAELITRITDGAGNLTTTLNTRLTLPYQRIEEGKTTWQCHIQHLYLTEGVYHVSVAAKDELKTWDSQDSCVEFEIEGSVNEKLAKNPMRRFGFLLPPHEWKLDICNDSTDSDGEVSGQQLCQPRTEL